MIELLSLSLLCASATGATAPPVVAAPAAEDPWLWLEDVESERALGWARAQNAVSGKLAEAPGFAELKARLKAVMDSSEKIPTATARGAWYYNLWKDADHPKGLWRRTTPASYDTDTPVWETVLDVDALGAVEGVSWVWHGADCLAPEYRRCLIELSRGGSDAAVVREFDTADKAFVTDGFTLPEAKSVTSWVDRDTIFVGTDFGPGSLTDSGYPRTSRRWRRGTDPAAAPVVFEGEASDVWAAVFHDDTPGFERSVAFRAPTFYSSYKLLVTRRGLEAIDKPVDATATLWRDWLLLELRSDYTVGKQTWKAGSLLAAPLKRWLRGSRSLTPLFVPTETTSLVSHSATKGHVLLNTLDTVRSRVEVLTPGKNGWSRAALGGAPDAGQVTVSALDPRAGDAWWMTTTGFVSPSTLWRGEVGRPPQPLKQLPPFFDATGLEVSQHMATSKDGTKIPYFQVARAGLELDGSHPTLLYGYGGFEVSLQPRYDARPGIGWLEPGGVYVVANIRGGGEFGPRWHQAALKANRHRAYEDFAAVARDLVSRGVTSKERLGAMGGSNGGLLIGNMYTLYPQEFGALVCKVPLLDMQRYNKLLAGASWMGEYGNPDVPDEWAWIRTFSPYHNVDLSKQHPPLLLTTSTRDDRVHPGHARKMAAKLLAAGKDVTYYENIEGGHGGAADNEQAAFLAALDYTFLWQRLAPVTAGQPPAATRP